MRVTNSETMSSFLELLDNRLLEMQRNINEIQNVIEDRQMARIEHVMSDGYKLKTRRSE